MEFKIKKNKKKEIIVDINNKSTFQDLLDKQEYNLLLDALIKYNPYKEDMIKNISEQIKLINEYLDDNHAYLYFAKSHLIFAKFKLQEKEKLINENELKKIKY